MDASAAVPAVRAWKPALPGVREVFHARSSTHAYPPHTHDVWTLFVVDGGAIRYDLDRRDRGAAPGLVSLLPPHVVHDGRPADGRGYSMRVLYLESSVLGDRLIGPAVDRPVIPDASLVARLGAIHDALACPDRSLEAEVRFAAVVERIRAALGDAPDDIPVPADGELAEALRAYLDAHVFEPVTMAAAGRALGSGTTRLARAFAETFAIAPHAYLIGRRLEAARELMLEGRPLADVAASVGFCDQAHLTRRFRRFLGTTPARFARSGRDRAALDPWPTGRAPVRARGPVGPEG
jgi:AraC-like DNA-binding protein